MMRHPGSMMYPTSSERARRIPERVMHAPQALTGPGLIRLRTRGRDGDLESLQQSDAIVVSDPLKPTFV